MGHRWSWVCSSYMRRQILHHFSWASIRKVWVYMLSTGYGAKNDAKLTAVCISTQEYLKKIFVPTLHTTGRTVNGLVAYDVVVSVPFIRKLPLLEGLKLYWQHGQDNVKNIQGVLGGGNIIGGVLEGGRWDVRFEFVETRDAGSVRYTHPTYTSGFAFQQFVIGHPIGGAAQGFFGRATYSLTPTAWIAADGRNEQYGFGT